MGKKAKSLDPVNQAGNWGWGGLDMTMKWYQGSDRIFGVDPNWGIF